MNAFIILSTAAVIIIFYYYWTLNYWKKRGVHTLKPNILFGNLSGVIFRKVPAYRMFQETYETCKKRGDKFIGFYFLNRPSLVIVDPELLKNVLTKDFKNFTDRNFYLNEKDPLTVNIASAKGSEWKKMRDQLSPAFSPSKLKNMYPTILQVAKQLKTVLHKSVENHEVVNLNDVSSKYVADAIGMGIFGIECNSLQNSNLEFRNNAENIFGGITQNIKVLLSLLYPSLLPFLKIPFISYDVKKFYLNLVKSTVEYRESNNIVRNDLMHSIIQLRNNINIKTENNLISSNNTAESEKSLKIEEITAQAIVFMGAAYETTATTITFCIYELAVNKDIQNMLREEINFYLGKHEGNISYDMIMNMPYLDKCVSETFRKYAIVSVIPRTCTEKYKLSNSEVLDVGSTVCIPVYEIHHDPEFYPNPEKFDPERFSPENKSKRPSYTFLSFGEGPRNCIGNRLGLLKIKIFLVTFLTNYNFTINCETQLPPSLDKSYVGICFEKPIYLNLEKI